jgi:phosphopantetheine--protein transferase-like protein
MEHEINLYTFDICEFERACVSPITWDELLDRAPDRERVMKYHGLEDRKRVLAAQLMVQKLVHGRVIRSNSENSHPVKPHSTNSGEFFNVSHDNNMVVVGISDTYSIGVDIMKIERTNPRVSLDEMFANLTYIMSPDEWGYINRFPDETSRLSRFHHMWTAKEAYVKSIGTGLYVEPNDLKVVIHDDNDPILAQVVHRNHESKSSKFRSQILPSLVPGYIVAVCIGPVSLCDVSWTRTSPPPRTVPRIDRFSVTLHRLELVDLVR